MSGRSRTEPSGVTPAGWFASRWSRLNGAGRVGGIDLARGLAIVGMFAAHMFDLPEVDPVDASTWGGIADGRSSILFATLAGVSLSLMTGGSRIPGASEANRARIRILVRAGFIWLLGVLLIGTGVPVYVILPAYAILFLLALPFLRVGPAPLLLAAGVLGVVMPFVQVLLNALPFWSQPGGAALSLLLGWHYPFPVWIAFLLCGMGIGRLDLGSLRAQSALLAAGAVAALVGYGLAAVSAPAAQASDYWSAVWTARPHSSGVLEVVGSGGFAIAVIAGSLLVCRTWLMWVVLPLRATGSMPLSAYTAQLVGWAIVAAAVLGDTGDLFGFRALQPFVPFTVWTIVGCTAWALLIGRGPLETIVDAASRFGAARSPAGARR